MRGEQCRPGHVYVGAIWSYAGLGCACDGPGWLLLAFFMSLLYLLIFSSHFPLYDLTCVFYFDHEITNSEVPGVIPDISPRDYVGLVESCVGSPKFISTTELVSIYSQLGQCRHTTMVDSIITSMYSLHGLN